MIYSGIDPGKDGAVAWLLPDGTVELHDVPTFAVKKTKREYDVPGMVSLLEHAQARGGGLRVCIEAVHSMPGQGVASTFSFGKGYGLWLGILGALRISFEAVAPQTWKKLLMANCPKEKEASVLVAGQLFPLAVPLLHGSRGAALDGRADALLLAEYARRTASRP
jgi:hypothetical protein